MKHLQTIQKTFHVFQILTKIAKIFCIVGASLCAVGALCVMVQYNGGQVFGLFGEPIRMFSDGENAFGLYARLIGEAVVIAGGAVLLTFAEAYLKAEQAAGTPFTEDGAKMLKKLGIRCIYIPIVAVIIAYVAAEICGADGAVEAETLTGATAGIAMIITSMIFRYGAELENRAALPDREQ